jgi:glutamate/tyrosine decarboxylase-like PLP-dependent enzyme
MVEEEIFDKLWPIIKAYRSRRNETPLVEYYTPQELSEHLHLDGDERHGEWEAVFDWIDKYLRYSVNTNHKGFVNRMWVGGNLPSILGEIVVAVTHTSSCTFESAPVSTLMEKHMLTKMLDLVGFVNGEGQMTTGSSNANMIAMMAARNNAMPGCRDRGLFNQQEMFAFASVDAHYSVDKAANILGLGASHLIKIPVNSQGEMDIAVLTEKMEVVASSGGRPFFVNCTAGTTVRGAYDNIEELLRLRDKYNFWLHVDGAWGGAVVVSDPLREKYLTGLEAVDSFTWDFHKMLGTSLMCNVFLINNKPHMLGNTCSCGDESYIFHDDTSNDVKDLGAVSLQCGRRVDSLKWFLDWKFFGQVELARRVETSLELCAYAESLVDASDVLEMVHPRTSFNICFCYRSDENISNDLNLAIRDKLYEKGVLLIGYAYKGKKLFLRLLLANSDLDHSDVDNLFTDLVETGKKLQKEM